MRIDKPLILPSAVLGSPVEGTLEYISDVLSFTIGTGPTRKTVAFTDSSITSSMYIGTTSVALNRASSPLALAGISSIGIRDTSAAYDVTVGMTSSTTLGAAKNLTIDMVNASTTIKLGYNLTLSAAATIGGTNTGDVTLATDNGLGLTNQVLSMGTPSTCTAATTNAVSTSTHTHAITGFLTAVTAHNVLSSTHGDTLADTVARGDIMYGNATPKWARLAFPGTPTGKVLIATATDVAWSASALGTGAYAVAGATLALDNLSSVAMNASLQWDNTTARTLDIAATANTVVGRALTISAGSTVTGGTADMAGGNLTLNSGLGKGTGESSIIFQTGRTLTTGSTLQTLTEAMRILGNGNVGIGTTNPTAYLHLKAGTATASTAPLKLTSGVLNTTPEAGALEFVTDTLSFTITSGTARKTIAFTDSPITSSMYLGTTSVALNRASAALALTGITSIVTEAAGTAAGLFNTVTTTGNIGIGGALTSGTLTLGNASATGNTTLYGAATSGTNSLFTNATSSAINIGTGQTSGLIVIGKTGSTGSTTINAGSGGVLIGTTGDLAVNTNQLYVDTSAAMVGINTSAPDQFLTIKATGDNANLGFYAATGGSSSRNWAFGTNLYDYGDFCLSQSTTAYGTPTVMKLKLDASGNLVVDTLKGTGSRTVVADANGLLSAPASDERLKINIEPISKNIPMEMLEDDNIRAVNYQWKDETKGKYTELGFTWQQFFPYVDKVPGLTFFDNGYGGINYEKISCILWEQNKQLLKRIEALEAKIK